MVLGGWGNWCVANWESTNAVIVPSSSNTQTPTPAAGFSSNTALAAPVSITPTAITNISTASSVTAPNSSPIVGLPGSASNVTPPNASTPTSSTPTSSGVTPPSGSSPGTASGVTPQAGGSGVTVTPQGYYNAAGKCIQSLASDECDTNKDLDAKATDLEKQANNSTGAAKERAELEASRIRAQLAMRQELGSDRKADYYLNRMDNSQAYNQLTPRERLEYWTGLKGKIDNHKYHENEIRGLIVALENGKVVRDGKGGIKLEYSPKGGGSSGGSNQDAAALGALSVNTLEGAPLAGAAIVTCIFLCSSSGQQAGAELFGSVVSLFDQVIESGKWLVHQMEKKESEQPKSTPPTIPATPGTSPGPDWVWKGRPGSVPGDKDGNWVNPTTGETLRPDMDHPDPVGGHYDWKDPSGKWWRIYPDGRIEPK